MSNKRDRHGWSNKRQKATRYSAFMTKKAEKQEEKALQEIKQVQDRKAKLSNTEHEAYEAEQARLNELFGD